VGPRGGEGEKKNLAGRAKGVVPFFIKWRIV